MRKDTPYPITAWYMGLLFLGGPLILLYHTFRIQNILLSIPFVVASGFFLSVVQVSPPGDHLRYRRLIKWKVIPYNQVLECREDSVFGYLRIKRYVPPWGKLYFTRAQVGTRWDSDVVATIRRRAKLD